MKTISYSLTLIWLACCVSFVPRIDNFSYDFIKSKGISEKDIIFRTLGAAKNLVSDISFLKADEYYHGGVKHKNLEPHPCLLYDQGVLGEEHHECLGHEHNHKHIHKHEEEGRDIFKFNFLPRLGGKLCIHQARHLHGQEEKEIIPWLYYSVELNPHNVEAYVIGAYWVGSRLGKIEEALKFLREGIKNNPDNWRLYSEAGNLYFNEKKDYRRAIYYYLKAESLMNDENADRFDKSHIYILLGASYENMGEIDKAVRYYRKDTGIFPSHEGLKKKIKRLEVQ